MIIKTYMDENAIGHIYRRKPMFDRQLLACAVRIVPLASPIYSRSAGRVMV